MSKNTQEMSFFQKCLCCFGVKPQEIEEIQKPLLSHDSSHRASAASASTQVTTLPEESKPLKLESSDLESRDEEKKEDEKHQAEPSDSSAEGISPAAPVAVIADSAAAAAAASAALSAAEASRSIKSPSFQNFLEAISSQSVDEVDRILEIEPSFINQIHAESGRTCAYFSLSQKNPAIIKSIFSRALSQEYRNFNQDFIQTLNESFARIIVTDKKGCAVIKVDQKKHTNPLISYLHQNRDDQIQKYLTIYYAKKFQSELFKDDMILFITAYLSLKTATKTILEEAESVPASLRTFIHKIRASDEDICLYGPIIGKNPHLATAALGFAIGENSLDLVRAISSEGLVNIFGEHAGSRKVPIVSLKIDPAILTEILKSRSVEKTVQDVLSDQRICDAVRSKIDTYQEKSASHTISKNLPDRVFTLITLYLKNGIAKSSWPEALQPFYDSASSLPTDFASDRASVSTTRTSYTQKTALTYKTSSRTSSFRVSEEESAPYKASAAAAAASASADSTIHEDQHTDLIGEPFSSAASDL